ncbi:MAG: DUF2851 family protein [Aureispira sp.]|nr:DUF2851 family protein [Aureispira sp.]
MLVPQLPEHFLHYIWQFQLFEHQQLQTTRGQSIQIVQTGILNKHAGPDFSDARIQLDQTLWAGHVEIHKKSSDWLKHQHQEDAAYDNVVLHVVYEDDHTIYRQDGTAIPTLELKGKIAETYIKKYWLLLQAKQWIPCQTQFEGILESPRLALWLDRLVIERLEQKTQPIHNLLEHNNNNWEQSFYQFLARGFGAKVNAEPFEQLAKSIPLLVLAKHKNNLVQLEAFLFGQAGLLDKDFEEEYPLQLKKEYSFLQKKYKLSPIKRASWKFGRIRPANSPTIRIAQFAKLIHQSTHLFSKILEVDTIQDIHGLFEVKLQDYWLKHYQFDKETTKRNKSLGKNAVDLLLINTIIPFLFVYAKAKADESYQDKALKWLAALPAEKNSIISNWEDLGIKVSSAQDSQALLQLKNVYCNEKRCLECTIGDRIMKGKLDSE